MAHTISERKRQQRLQELAPEVIREQQRRTRQEINHAKRVVALWNMRSQLGRRQTFFPTTPLR